jgi:hypothetical protein
MVAAAATMMMISSMGSPRGRVVVVVGIGDLNSVLGRIFSGLLVSVVVVVASAFVVVGVLLCCY